MHPPIHTPIHTSLHTPIIHRWKVPTGAVHAAVITPLVETILVSDPARRPDVFTITQVRHTTDTETTGRANTNTYYEYCSEVPMLWCMILLAC